MKIYTKKGDKGSTSLLGGTRVSKSHLRIETYGTVDELNSWIGLLRDHAPARKEKELLKHIQDRLFTLGALLATDRKKKLKLPQLKEADVTRLEQEIDRMESALPPMRSFVLPGGHPVVSYCHITRCVCRRAERLVVRLGDTEKGDALHIQYLNRLSDYLFVLSRHFSKALKAEETPWRPEL